MPQKKQDRKERLARLAALPDSGIDFSDAPEATTGELAKGVWRNHGGARPGAGRKRAAPQVRLTLSVSPTFRRKLQAVADREGLTLSAYVQTHFAG